MEKGQHTWFRNNIEKCASLKLSPAKRSIELDSKGYSSDSISLIEHHLPTLSSLSDAELQTNHEDGDFSPSHSDFGNFYPDSSAQNDEGFENSTVNTEKYFGDYIVESVKSKGSHLGFEIPAQSFETPITPLVREAIHDSRMYINGDLESSSITPGDGSSFCNFDQILDEEIGCSRKESSCSDVTGDEKPTGIFPHARPIKRRRRLNSEETKYLQDAYERNPKPSAEYRSKIAQSLNMSTRAIQIWFQNRRAKSRKFSSDKNPSLTFSLTEEYECNQNSATLESSYNDTKFENSHNFSESQCEFSNNSLPKGPQWSWHLEYSNVQNALKPLQVSTLTPESPLYCFSEEIFQKKHQSSCGDYLQTEKCFINPFEISSEEPLESVESLNSVYALNSNRNILFEMSTMQSRDSFPSKCYSPTGELLNGISFLSYCSHVKCRFRRKK